MMTYIGLALLLSGVASIAVYWYGRLTKQAIILGRRSEYVYVRFYPNPGFMLPIWGRRQLVFTNFDGLFTRKRGTRTRPAR